MQTWRQDNGTMRMQEVAKVDDFEYLGEMAIFGGLVGYVFFLHYIGPYAQTDRNVRKSNNSNNS